jgi:hypothetical protein
MESGEKKKSLPTWAIVLIVLGILGVIGAIGIVVLATLGVYGTRKYIGNAKEAEGRSNVMALAKGAAAAGSSEEVDHATGKVVTGLPPSSKPVPASISDVAGKKYMSRPTDWSADPGFKAARFEMMSPQYFQYQWEQLTPTKGVARAKADMDGDGKLDVTFEVDVTCASGSCTTGALRETR